MPEKPREKVRKAIKRNEKPNSLWFDVWKIKLISFKITYYKDFLNYYKLFKLKLF